jgi:non-specific serine/threonine protein kinase/serine/threonine-protein kinase
MSSQIPDRRGAPNPLVTDTAHSQPEAEWAPVVAASPALTFEARFQALSELARGGQGRIVVAHDTMLRREVALKELLRAESGGAVRRFEREALLTARLQHPAIVSIYELARRRSGEPVLVMRRVQGKPFDRAIAEAGTYEKRLALLAPFTVACDAIAYAHQQRVIHRDIKPANVLLGDFGDTVVIDWGIAKEVGAEPVENESTNDDPALEGQPLTATGELIGTPAFMSPEQARGEPADAQSDVYALGAMLYQLLSGRRPYEQKNRKEILEAIKSGPPTPVATLVPGVAPELATLVGRAMAKDRKERYATAGEVAEELKRFQTGRLVRSHNYSTWQLLRRWVRRHAALIVMGAIAIALLAAVGALSIQRILAERERANREAAAASRVSGFMTSMFKVSDPSEARGNSVTAREILEKATGEIHGALAQDPVLRARMTGTMGTVYANLGLYGKAHPLLETALAEQRRALGPDAPETLQATREMGRLLFLEGRFSESEKLLRETIGEQRRVFGREHAETALSMQELVATLHGKGDYAQAESLQREALEIQLRILAPDHPDVLRSMNGLATMLNVRNRYAEAEKLHRDVFEVDERVLGPNEPQTILALNNLAADIAGQRRYAEAEKLHRETLSRARRVLGTEHRLTVVTLHSLAIDLKRLGRFQEAETTQREGVELSVRALGPRHPLTLKSMMDLGLILKRQLRYEEADALLRQTLDLSIQVLGPRHPETVMTRYNLACNSALSGHRNEALGYLRAALENGLTDEVSAGIEQDTDFKPLHGDPHYEAIIADARKRAAK